MPTTAASRTIPMKTTTLRRIASNLKDVAAGFQPGSLTAPRRRVSGLARSGTDRSVTTDLPDGVAERELDPPVALVERRRVHAGDLRDADRRVQIAEYALEVGGAVEEREVIGR